jgi:hypothetical protein
MIGGYRGLNSIELNLVDNKRCRRFFLPGELGVSPKLLNPPP